MKKRAIELIDRNEILRKIEPWLYSDGRGDSELYMLRAVIAVLKETPAIDAVPVVRCKDCQSYTRVANSESVRTADVTS